MKYVINNDVLEYVVPEAEDKEIIIPDGVKSLGKSFGFYSFFHKMNECINISRIFIPASLGENNDVIDESDFIDLKNLEAFVVDSRNPIYESIDGVLFVNQNDNKTLIVYPRGRICKEYTIPNGVTHIRAGAFDSVFNGPHSIVFPPSMKSVDLRFSGTYNAIKHIAVYEDFSYYFGKDLKDGRGCTTWLWNWHSKNNLIITVLSMDGNIKYRIPIFVKWASYEAQMGICLACNPINKANLTKIDEQFEHLNKKDEKLLTATVRIGWPHKLGQAERIKYEKYVSRYIKDAVNAVIKSGYIDLLEVFVKNRLIKKTAFPEILAELNTPEYVELHNMLLDYFKTL